MKIEELFKSLKEKLAKAEEFFFQELASIRTGRAQAALVEGIKVEAYGSTAPLKTLASVTVPESNQLLVEPWDKSLLGAIERGLREADLGLSINNEGQHLRLILPSLTVERREELAKLAHRKTEEARVAVRNIRREIFEELEKLKEEIGEESLRREEKRFQEVVDEINKKIEENLTKKENEIRQT